LDKQRLYQWGGICLILLWLGWHLILPINLVASDMGRYINNGELILQGQWDVLYKNYYSYTNPQYPFFNYHWLFGVFCYAVWHWAGFTGLAIVYIAIELLTFFLFFRCWQRFSSFLMLCAFGLLSFPLISMRDSIRPEGFSYLFCGLFWLLIDRYQQKWLKPHYLIIALCIVQILWVNTHIFFMMGPVLTAFFWWQARCNKEEEQVNVLQKLFCLLCGMCLINPFGINLFGLVLDTWKASSVAPVIESQSMFYFLSLKTMPDKSICFYFLAILGMLILPLISLIQREGLKKYIFIALLIFLLAFAALKSIRMIGLFGYIWIPISSYLYSGWIRTETVKLRKNIEIFLVVIGILVSALVGFDWKQSNVLGIVPGTNDAAEFFKREKIQGPIFNNYNIGGYLIFHLSPEYKLFVDNRGLAAYPDDFFIKTYIPMQRRDDVWKRMDQRYHFNVIFYSPMQPLIRDRFVWNRINDPSWALVFFKKDVVIFLKRDQKNDPIIRRFEEHLKIISPTEIDVLRIST